MARGGAGGGDKNHHHHHLIHLNFHLNLSQMLNYHHRNQNQNQIQHNRNHHQVPKGFVAVMVGEENEMQRFEVPVAYVNHPLFMKLLKEAEEEYGFDHEGVISIPCNVDEFRRVQDMIDLEKHHHHNHHTHNNHHHHAWCFKA